MEPSSGRKKLSELNEAVITPKPDRATEGFNFYCPSYPHPDMSNLEGKEDTAAFIGIAVTFGQLLPLKGLERRHCNPLEEAIYLI